MRISFKLCSPPFSINSAYYKRSKTRTKECREWGDNILIQLQNQGIQAMFKTMQDVMPEFPLIAVNLTFQSPKATLYTKAGGISIRAMDLSNVEKLLIDLIFDKRFHGRKVKNQTVYNLNVDDKYIVDLHSSKRESKDEDFHILIDIQLVENLL